MAVKEGLDYVFRNLKVYFSKESFADNKKNYRSIFEAEDTDFIYFEFSFFNLHYKKDDWKLPLKIVCVDGNKKEIFNLSWQKPISKNNNINYIREGWGTKSKGAFWKEGSYRIEAYIEDQLVAEKNFYILNQGSIHRGTNKYFGFNDIQFYEGPLQDVEPEQRKYFDTFSQIDSRFIYAEINLTNLAKEIDYWPCEFVFNIRANSNLLKASIPKLNFVYQQDDTFNFTVCCTGSEKPGSWHKGYYGLEVLFMGEMVARASFEIGNDFEVKRSENPEIQSPPSQEPAAKTEVTGTSETDKSIEKTLEEFDELVGLESVKDRIEEYSSYLEFISLRKDKGLKEEEDISLHAIFKGNPGTGKTTVARKLGKIYKNLGLLSKGHVHEVDRSDLVAEFIGQTAPKTKAAIKKARGGILFIDEAYALARKDDDAKDFGREAIEILLKELSDADDIAIIAAGYPDEMDHFLESNPGLKSRFRMIYDFPDYLPQELIEIATRTAKKRGISFNKESKEAFYKKIVEAFRNRDKFFGNARLVVSLIDECKMNLGIRVMSIDDPSKLAIKDLSSISIEDVEKLSITVKSQRPDIPIDEELLEESLEKLNGMMGLESVKEDIQDLVKLVRYYRETEQEESNTISLHSVFTGNPGTGKTTVARILSQIYKALGILEKGNLIEVDRQSLVGGYVGQTAIKTGEAIDKAMGGVLFIDEAYSLTEGGSSDFGKEAIEIILKRMEDFRGKFIVIAAGYTDNMKRFLESNPGLKSRFDKVFTFEDFNAEDLSEIAITQFKDNGLNPDKKAKTKINAMMKSLFEERDKYFGNGRSVRKIVEEAIRNQHLRMSNVDSKKRTKKMMATLTSADLEDITLKDKSKPDNAPSLGFRISN